MRGFNKVAKLAQDRLISTITIRKLKSIRKLQRSTETKIFEKIFPKRFRFELQKFPKNFKLKKREVKI